MLVELSELVVEEVLDGVLLPVLVVVVELSDPEVRVCVVVGLCMEVLVLDVMTTVVVDVLWVELVLVSMVLLVVVVE